MVFQTRVSQNRKNKNLIAEERSAMRKEQKEVEKWHQKELGMLRGAPPRGSRPQRPKPKPKEKEKKKETSKVVAADSNFSHGYLVQGGSQSYLSRISGWGGGSSTGFGATDQPLPSASPPALIPAGVAAKAVEQLVLTPFSENLLARWPDTYSLIPTYVSKDLIHKALTVYPTNINSGTADRAIAYAIHGDPNYSGYEPSAINSTSVGTKGAITWWTPGVITPPVDTLQDSVPDYCYNRPVGLAHKFTFSAVGPYHTIVMRIMELGPCPPPDIASAVPVVFPTQVSAGPTFIQRQFCRAREIALQPGESFTLICLPCDALSLAYWRSRTSRYDSSADLIYSWSDFIIWGYGLEANDTVYHDAVYHHEFYRTVDDLFANSTAVTAGSAIVLPSTSDTDQALTKVAVAAGNGFNVVRDIVEGVSKFVKKAVPFVSGIFNLLGTPIAPLSSSAPCPLHLSSAAAKGFVKSAKTPTLFSHIMARFNPPHSLRLEGGQVVDFGESKSEDSKQVGSLDEQPILLTPINARRASITSTLSSGRKQLR